MNIINLQDKKLYFIGGAVRDELLGLKSYDIDITYEGNAVEFAKTIANAEILQINKDFATVRLKLNNEIIDIASTRNEIYPRKGHLPVVQNIGCSLKEDVLRRDFTVNALAKSVADGKITDYTTGLKDIKNKTLRVLHDNSFIDDPTRILRALKFSIRFGFKLDKHTKQLQDKYLNNVNYDMSYKRLKKELVETFNLNSQKAFERFINEKIYKLITAKNFDLPQINFEKLIKKYNPKTVWIVYVGQIPDVYKLPLTKKEKKIIDDFYFLKEKSFNTDLEIYKNFEKLNIESIIMFAGFQPEIVQHYLENLKNIKLKINGNDIQNLGIEPSNRYSLCFDYVLDKKLKNPSLTKKDEIELVKEFFAI